MESKQPILIIVDTEEQREVISFFLRSRGFPLKYTIKLASEFTNDLALALDKKIVMFGRKKQNAR